MVSKIPAGVKPNVKRIAAFAVKQFPNITHVWGYASSQDHNSRECVDYMITNPKISPAARKKLGDDLASWLIAQHQAGNLKIKFMVWRGRAWRPTKNSHGPAGWGAYYLPASHYDHVHVQIEDWFKAPVQLTRWTTKPTKGYGRFPGGARVTQNRAKGFRLVGIKGTLSDGDYLVTRFGTWYPMDSLTATRPS